MIKIEEVEVVGWRHALRGMRNPKNSWAKSDSYSTHIENPHNLNEAHFEFFVGDEDLSLAEDLRHAGTDHRKFMRMIVVYLDITAPLYWWKEFDTYKVGTVANSCSTMHKISAKEFTLEDFSCEHLMSSNGKNGGPLDTLGNVIADLNYWRERYLAAQKNGADGFELKSKWWQMIQLLPSSYNQRRTVMLNYEVLANIYKSRKNHKLDEWRTLCEWIEELPYSELITGKER